MWRNLVLGVLKQGLGCDFDRLQELANLYRTCFQVVCLTNVVRIPISGR